MVRVLGCSLGSTTSVRDVPSGSGWPGHSAADAVRAVTQTAMPRHMLRHKAAHGRFRTPTTTLAIIEPRLHSISAVNFYMPRHECSLNAPNSTLISEFLRLRRRLWRRPEPDGPRDSDCRADSAGKPAAWPRCAPAGRGAG